jgi:guanidinobutyrase
MFGEKVTHGTWLRRAVEEGLIDPRRSVQVGLRGTGYTPDEFDWPREQVGLSGASQLCCFSIKVSFRLGLKGIRVVPAEECWHKSLTSLAGEIKAMVGEREPVYVTFDIDGIDPAYAPGTGTVEIGGLTVPQALELLRGLRCACRALVI